MTFRAKVDSFFVTFTGIAICIIAVACFFPLFLEGGREQVIVIPLASAFLIITGFILWSVWRIKYVLNEDYLLVKGGPFKSKISYMTITKVTSTSDIYTGYRILSSRDALEIIYPTGLLGSVKISPEDKVSLKKKCPHADFHL